VHEVSFFSQGGFGFLLLVSFSSSLPVMGRLLVGRKFWGFAWFLQSDDISFLPRCREVTQLKAGIE
jgi:hypothetical protein